MKKNACYVKLESVFLVALNDQTDYKDCHDDVIECGVVQDDDEDVGGQLVDPVELGAVNLIVWAGETNYIRHKPIPAPN